MRIGFDIGGTKTEAVLLSERPGTLDILARKRISTDRNRQYEDIVEDFKNLSLAILKEANVELKQVESIGLGLPGTIHPESQIMLNGNSQVFVGKNLSSDLKKALNFSANIRSANDANCFALAEVIGGAGLLFEKETGKAVKEQTAIGIIIGTGCGGGIVINGQVLNGATGGAGEIGHTELYTDGHSCYCGMKGCAEQYLSGPAIEGHFARRMDSQMEKRPNAKEIFELSKNGDPIALAVVKQYYHDLSKFMATLTNILAPDYFVLGGGVSLQEDVIDYFKDGINYPMFIKGYSPKVYQHQLGDSAGVIGAAFL